MAWNLGTIVASGIIVGGLAIGTVAYTGTDGLKGIGNFAEDMKNRIFNLDETASNYEDAFNKVKNDAIARITEANTLLAEKNGWISGLNSQIVDLQKELENGAGNTSALTQEIERLNAEVSKANTEIQALQTEIASYQAEIGTTGTTVVLAESLDTSLPSIVDGMPQEEGSEGEPATTPAPAPVVPVVYDLSFLPSAQQNTLKAMGINNISNITKTGSNTLNIYADAGFNYSAPSVYNNAVTFKNEVVSRMNTKVGISDTYLQKVIIRTHDGTIVKTLDTVSNGWN